MQDDRLRIDRKHVAAERTATEVRQVDPRKQNTPRLWRIQPQQQFNQPFTVHLRDRQCGDVSAGDPDR
jgi:hypothetical protein